MSATINIMMHTTKFMNGNSVSVSELINGEAVNVRLVQVAGPVEVETRFFLSIEAARHLGKLLVKHYNKEEEAEKDLKHSELQTRKLALIDQCAELLKENEKLRSQIKPAKPAHKTGGK